MKKKRNLINKSNGNESLMTDSEQEEMTNEENNNKKNVENFQIIKNFIQIKN